MAIMELTFRQDVFAMLTEIKLPCWLVTHFKGEVKWQIGMQGHSWLQQI